MPLRFGTSLSRTVECGPADTTVRREISITGSYQGHGASRALRFAVSSAGVSPALSAFSLGVDKNGC
jgi:hypothetical protein